MELAWGREMIDPTLVGMFRVCAVAKPARVAAAKMCWNNMLKRREGIFSELWMSNLRVLVSADEEDLESTDVARSRCDVMYFEKYWMNKLSTYQEATQASVVDETRTIFRQ
jgi:hypothetical protein